MLTLPEDSLYVGRFYMRTQKGAVSVSDTAPDDQAEAYVILRNLNVQLTKMVLTLDHLSYRFPAPAVGTGNRYCATLNYLLIQLRVFPSRSSEQGSCCTAAGSEV